MPEGEAIQHAALGAMASQEPPLPVSVVVPTHNRRASVLRLCDALSRQSVPSASFELVVSIDGSTDGTREALTARTDPYRTRVLWHENRGRSAARNAGIAASTGELLILLDDDMEPSPAFIEAHRRAHPTGTRRGVMGAVPMDVDGATSAAARYVADKFNGHLENLRRPEYTLRLTDFYSGNFSIRREVLRQTGGFDEDFRIYGNEDLELSHRLVRAGVQLVYEPTALAHQHNDKTFATLVHDRLAEGRTAVLFAQKHPEVFDDLKLGTFHEGPWPLRLVRNLLLALGRRWTHLPDAIARLEAMLARSRSPGVGAFYRLVLGYFYWMGVRDALHAPARTDCGDERLLRLAAELSR